MDSQGYQTSATDPNQQAYAGRKVRQREQREAELWRWCLSQKMGREFLWDVLLRDVGYDQPVAGLYEQSANFLSANAAMHNLGCHWMHAHIRRHRDLFLQMLNEASKREDDAAKEEETMRATWARDEDETP